MSSPITLSSGTLVILGLEYVDRLPLPLDRTDEPLGTFATPDCWGVWAQHLAPRTCLVDGVRSARPLQIWDEVRIRIAAGDRAESRLVGEVLSSGCIVALDADALSRWNDEAPPSRADVLCWGSHAATVARRLGLSELRPGVYGWRDVPIDEGTAREQRILDAKWFWYGLQTAIRPHTRSWRVERALDAVDLAGTDGDVVVFRTHQDGSWAVWADLAADGALLGLRVVFGP